MERRPGMAANRLLCLLALLVTAACGHGTAPPAAGRAAANDADTAKVPRSSPDAAPSAPKESPIRTATFALG